MIRHRRWLALGLALSLAGCVAPVHITPTKGHGPLTPLASTGPAVLANLISEHGGSVISDQGSGLISNNGGGLTGKTKIPTGIVANNGGNLISDAGGGIIANNAGNLISDHGGAVIANNAGNLVNKQWSLLAASAVSEAPAVGFPVTIVDASGNPVLDQDGKPYRTTTAKDGAYSFTHTPRGANLVVRVELPAAVGPMLAYLPTANVGATRQADVGYASTLVMGYVLEKFVRNQTSPNATLQKLPGDVEATTRAKAAAAYADQPDLTSFKPDAIVSKVDDLGRSHADLAAQVEVVRKLLVAGLSDVGEGQLASAVALSAPKSVTRLPDGNLLIAERNGHRLRLLDIKTQHITTFAGKDGSTAVGDGGPATDAFIDRPVAVAADAQGNVFVSDFGHHVIRRVDAKTHLITTVAGTGKNVGDEPNTVPFDGAVATQVNLGYPIGLAVDGSGRPVFVSNDGLMRVEADGKLKVLSWGDIPYPHSLTSGPDGKVYAFDGASGLAGVLDGDFFTTLKLPMRVSSDDARLAVGSDHTFYLTDDDKLQKATLGGANWSDIGVSTSHGYWAGLTVTPVGLAVCDGQFNRLWQVPFAGGEAVSLAGLDVSTANALSDSSLSLNRPTAIISNGPGRLLVADGLNGVVWERRTDGLFYRFAGGPAAKGTDTDLGDGGPASAARLLKVASLLRLRDGTLLIGEADPPAFHIRAITPDGTITTRPMPEGLYAPAYMVEAADGSLLLSDYLTKKIMRWKGDSLTPAAPDVDIKKAGGILALPDGSFYVSDIDNEQMALWHVVAGKGTLVAGGTGTGFSGDGGPALQAKLAGVSAMALATNGDLFLADTRNDRVRRIRAKDQQIDTIAGQGGVVFNGQTPDDSLKEPLGLVFDASGDLYVSDSGHNQIKRIEAAKLK